jgi:hypothetical protein
MEKIENNKKRDILRLIYLYLFSAIGLILIIMGSVRLLDLGMKTFIFKKADIYYIPKIAISENNNLSKEELEKNAEEQRKAEEENRRSQRQRDISNSLAMIIVGTPLYFYHWRLVMKYKENN